MTIDLLTTYGSSPHGSHVQGGITAYTCGRENHGNSRQNWGNAMRRISLWAMSIAMIALPLANANADTIFDWSITSPSSTPALLSGSGTLDTTSEGGGEYLVNSIAGTANGMAVTIIGVGLFEGNDNLLYYPATSNIAPDGAPCGIACQLDNNGLAFSLTNGAQVDIFETGNPGMTTNCDTSGVGAPQCSQSDETVFSASPEVSATPLPAALPLFAGGLGMLGLFGRRRKQKALNALAA